MNTVIKRTILFLTNEFVGQSLIQIANKNQVKLTNIQWTNMNNLEMNKQKNKQRNRLLLNKDFSKRTSLLDNR